LQLDAGQGSDLCPARQMESDITHPPEERGPGLTAQVHAIRPFNQAILAEQKIHFNARIATTTYYF